MYSVFIAHWLEFLGITQPLTLRLNSYDEWLGAKYLLKRTEENIQKLKELKDKHSVEKNTKPGRLSHDKTKSPTGWTNCLSFYRCNMCVFLYKNYVYGMKI